jgi:hypothetical protein
MTLYYVKQDNMSWCCEDDSGPYYEDHEESFVNCECELPDGKMTADHLHGCNGGGPVLKWREATDKECAAYQSGWLDGRHDQSEDDYTWTEIGERNERERIIRIIEKAIIDSEGYCHADTVIALIKGENK